MKVTDTFRRQVLERWGNLKSVGEAGQNEMFSHGEAIGLDHDDQVGHAMDIGILVGETKGSDPEEFIRRFEEEILNAS